MELRKRPQPFQVIDWQKSDDVDDYFYLTIADADGEEIATIVHRTGNHDLDDAEALAKVDHSHQIVAAMNNFLAPSRQHITLSKNDSIRNVNVADDGSRVNVTAQAWLEGINEPLITVISYVPESMASYIGAIDNLNVMQR